MEGRIPSEHPPTPAYSSPDESLSDIIDASTFSHTNPKPNRRGKHDPEPDWSEVLRARYSQKPTSKRTARACDRCKCRKLPCDLNLNGCNNCAQKGCECNMTDQITGQTHPRNIIARMTAEIEDLRSQLQLKHGEVQALSDHIRMLESHIKALESQMDQRYQDFLMTMSVNPFDLISRSPH